LYNFFFIICEWAKCLSLFVPSELFQPSLRVRSGVLGAPLLGKLLALLANIMLIRKTRKELQATSYKEKGPGAIFTALHFIHNV
jgi:hypothetical protein